MIIMREYSCVLNSLTLTSHDAAQAELAGRCGQSEGLAGFSLPTRDEFFIPVVGLSFSRVARPGFLD